MVNEVTATQMEQAKELDVSASKVEEPVQVMMKDPKKVAVGKKLAEIDCRKKEILAQEDKAQDNEFNLSYSIGAVIAVGAFLVLTLTKEVAQG